MGRAINSSPYGIQCEVIKYNQWYSGSFYNGDICFVEKVPITSDGLALISNARSVGGIFMQYNKDVKFLPTSYSIVFEGTKVYDASHCSISRISKKNFDGVTGLRRLWLGGNFIDNIPGDAFKHLLYLTELNLGKKN